MRMVQNTDFGLLPYSQGKLWFIKCCSWMCRYVRPDFTDSVTFCIELCVFTYTYMHVVYTENELTNLFIIYKCKRSNCSCTD